MANMRPTRKKSSQSSIDPYDEIKLLWLLRILVPLEGHKLLLREKNFSDDSVARAVGLCEYLAPVTKARDFDHKAILADLHQAWHAAERRGLAMPVNTTLAVNVSRMGAALKLTSSEMSILHFSVLVQLDWLLQAAISCMGSLSLPLLERLFAICLGLKPEDVKYALSDDSTLFRTGVLWPDLNANYEFVGKVELLKGLADELHRSHADPLGLFRNNIVPSEPARLTMEDYPHLARDAKIIHGYLDHAGRSKQGGFNVLIHGVPGSGKTEFIRMLAHSAGFHLYEVATENRHGRPLNGDNRFRAYQLAQSLLANRNDSLILFDEVEDVFRDTGDDLLHKGNQSGKKGWVNRLLETNSVPAFWLTNNLYFVDPAALRRFDYIIEMNAPPRSVRARILDHYLSGLPVSDSWKRQMAAHEDLVPAVVERATKVIRSLKDEQQGGETEKALDRVMGNTLDALGFPRKSVAHAQKETRYRLEILNADCDISEVCGGLLREQSGRLCLYGPPGTGKTAFGRHVAEVLDRPLQVKRVSDILSPYVGVAEKNMARLFRQAEDDDAVLMLDEADTYLQDRKGAQRSWEISHVNEMLTQMENFDGIFIASTNLMTSLDEAALRRFDLKICFDYLKPEQAWKMFCDTAQILGFDVDDALEHAVSRIGLLTPGDFATVVRQARLRNVTGGHDLYNRLVAERAAKPEGVRRAIGF